MNNPYINNQNPYMAYMQAYNQQMPQRQNVLPAQQVIQVNGKASAQSIQMSPNSSLIVADNSAPIIYMCISDGVGNVTVTAYDIAPHQDKPPIDVNGIETRLQKVENILSEMRENNVKPNPRNFEQKTNNTEFSANQKRN